MSAQYEQPHMQTAASSVNITLCFILSLILVNHYMLLSVLKFLVFSANTPVRLFKVRFMRKDSISNFSCSHSPNLMITTLVLFFLIYELTIVSVFRAVGNYRWSILCRLDCLETNNSRVFLEMSPSETFRTRRKLRYKLNRWFLCTYRLHKFGESFASSSSSDVR